DLHEALVVEITANAADDLDALERPLEDLWVVNQVEVTVAQAELDVSHAAPLVGMRRQRLAEEVQLLGEQRRLARLGLTERAVRPDQVAQVDVRHQLPAHFRDLFLPDHDLELAAAAVARGRRPVPQVQEKQLPLPALADDPAGGADLGALALRLVRIQCQDVADGGVAVKTPAPWVEAELLDLAQLLPAAFFKVVGRS